MEGWSDFFLGELGAAAALAGLLFVAVSVNQARIHALGRMADRGIEALAMLFLVLVIAAGGLVVLCRGDGTGLYLVAAGILLTFLAVGANAWMLPIEINR